MPSPAQQVDSTFALAKTYAEAASTKLTDFTNALNQAIFTPPTISLKWESVAPPADMNLPGVPTFANVQFNTPGGQPIPLNESLPGITIDSFNEQPPELLLPGAPTISYGTAPVVPALRDVPVPDAPEITLPALPTLVQVNTVPFGGVDLHEDWLTSLGDRPTLSIVQPTPFSYAPGEKYASDLLANLQALMAERLRGGTGLSPAVEQALWDRARSREVQTSLANEAEVMRASEALGFQLPSGVLAAQMREVQQDYYDKVSTLSRDISIKQADLEQQNLKDTITTGIQLESQLIDYSYKLEQLAFDAARTAADNAVQLYNAAVGQYRALLEGYQAYASVYKTIIDGQLAKVEVYRAQLQGESQKVEINNALVQQYKAQIEANMSVVEIFRAQVNAAQTLVQLEGAKVGAAGEQIRAYVAQVNAETAKVEAYKAGIQAEATKIDIYRVKASAFSAKTGAQAEYARALISRYSALAQAKASEWDAYRAKVATEGTRIDALARQNATLLDAYRAVAAAVEAQSNMAARKWESNIKQYEASQTLTLQTSRANADAIIATRNAQLDAAKAGSQVFAQLTGSAYQMMHAQASVSGTAQNTVSYSYGGQVLGDVPATTAV